MFQVYIGFDPRSPVEYHILAQSIIERTSVPVSIMPLDKRTLPTDRVDPWGISYLRFLVPWLNKFRGRAVYMDSNAIVLNDIMELDAIIDAGAKAIWLRDSTFASPMLFNCAHPNNKVLTPDYIQDSEHLKMPQRPDWCDPDQVGELGTDWSHMVLYDEPRFDAKLISFPCGIPLFPETQGCEYTSEYMQIARNTMSTSPWDELLGKSMHAERVAKFMKKRDLYKDDVAE